MSVVFLALLLVSDVRAGGLIDPPPGIEPPESTPAPARETPEKPRAPKPPRKARAPKADRAPKPDRAAQPAAPVYTTDALAEALGVVRAAFRACLDPSESAGFDQYIDLVHSEQKVTMRSVQQIRTYSWSKFRGGCRQWLKSDAGLDFVVERTIPPRLTAESDRVKVFFKAQRTPEGGGPLRYPAPVELRKEADKWMIWTMSL